MTYILTFLILLFISPLVAFLGIIFADLVCEVFNISIKFFHKEKED